MDQWSVLLDDMVEMVASSDDPPEVKFNRSFARILKQVPGLRLAYWNFLARCTDRNSWQIDRADKIFIEEPSTGPVRPDLVLYTSDLPQVSSGSVCGFACEHKVWSDNREEQLRKYSETYSEPDWITVNIIVREDQKWSPYVVLKLLWANVYPVIRDAWEREQDTSNRRLLRLLSALVGRFRQPYDELYPSKPKRDGRRRYTTIKGWELYIPELEEIRAALKPAHAFRPTDPDGKTADPVWENDVATPYHRVCAYACAHGMRYWTEALPKVTPLILSTLEKADAYAKAFHKGPECTRALLGASNA